MSGIGSIFHTDLSARQPRQARGSGNAATLGSGQAQVFYGSENVADARGERTTASTYEPGEFNLNFENADLREVVQAILGNALKENYTIDPGINGTVTLSSARALGRDELLPALEVVLQSLGAALVHAGGVYRITLEPSAVAGTVDRYDATPGYGITIIPIEYVAAKTLITLIEGFGVHPGALVAEAKRNFIAVLGSSADRQAAAETVLSFDTDWMASQSVAILPLRHSKPEAIIPELQRVFATRDGEVGANLVQFMPMQRLQAVLVVSPRRLLIDRARTWVERLDTENPDLQSNVLVYRVKYRDADKLATLLSNIFGGSGAFAPTTPAEQVAPGSDAVTLEAPAPGGADRPSGAPPVDLTAGQGIAGRRGRRPSAAPRHPPAEAASRFAYWRIRPTTRW